MAHFKKEDGQWSADDLGRRYVRSPFYGEALTHIVGINWKHAGQTQLSELEHAYTQPTDVSPGLSKIHHSKCEGHAGRIVLTFDRALAVPHHCQDAPPHVQIELISTYFAQLMQLDYVVDFEGNDPPPEILSPRLVQLSPCHKQLWCDFPVRKIRREVPVLIRLSLNCDMVVDNRGRAVDGDHLNGGLAHQSEHGRTGNGIEGGLFQSWTRLIN